MDEGTGGREAQDRGWEGMENHCMKTQQIVVRNVYKGRSHVCWLHRERSKRVAEEADNFCMAPGVTAGEM